MKGMRSLRLAEELRICHVHLNRLEQAWERVKNLLPITENTVHNLNFNDLASLELFTNRLAKLQDALGSKVFPLFLEVLAVNGLEDTPIDRLNRLEKLNIITSAEYWKDLRDMRNTLAHDYPEDTEFMANMLNAYFLAFDEFKLVIENIERILKEKLG